MKFVVLGTTEFTLRCTQGLVDGGCQVCALISLSKELLPNNSANIEEYAQKYGIPYHEINDINSADSLRLIKSFTPDYIFSSWPKMLGSKVLAIPKTGTIGTHPTSLPFNRGRHPLHWLIVLGIPQTHLSFFSMNQGVDTGEILLQVPFSIMPDEKIGDLVVKMNQAAYDGTKKLCRMLLRSGFGDKRVQDHFSANYWRKRTPHDVVLDPRMSVEMILRTIKSFAPPYPCAKLIFENYIIEISDGKILKSKIAKAKLCRMEHGKIIRFDKKSVAIKVGDGVVELKSRKPFPPELSNAKYIYPPSKYMIQWPRELINQFPA